MSATAQLPRHIAVLILAALACSFAGNHIAARIAFDHDTGLLLAMLCRAGVTLLVLAALVFYRGEALRLSRQTWGWQLMLGLLIAVQSFCIYSAVMRIPVALALLVVNLAPIFLALLSWALGGPAPTRRATVLMGTILFGLVLALDVPAQLANQRDVDASWIEGVLFSATGAAVFACALWITAHRLAPVPGTVRSMLTLLVVFVSTAIIGASGVLPGGMDLPTAPTGWIALACLVLLYGMAFSALFVFVSRLDITRNAPVMNIEPVAGLLFGWLILDQLLNGVQIIGGLIVVCGVVLLASSKQP
ncbi:EamA family transporter [Pseudomonas sp. RL_15y_Pfl2_60]|uniref:EamA family transporter n=1 Tax=Pseudomonas sp. RL_15y_Pfl2_60 TaxID=3088709 RepID=UPI0030D942C2